MQIFRIRDNKAQTYDQMFVRPNHLTAIRSIEDAMEDPNNPWTKHPQDYSLFHIGEDDDTDGIPIINSNTVHIIDLLEIHEAKFGKE